MPNPVPPVPIEDASPELRDAVGAALVPAMAKAIADNALAAVVSGPSAIALLTQRGYGPAPAKALQLAARAQALELIRERLAAGVPIE
jgi:hypothetical protein